MNGPSAPETGTPTTVHLLRWRAVAAALPALALLSGGLALAGSGAPAGPTHGAGASVTRGATLPVVPTAPVTVPGTSGGLAPGLMLPPVGSGSYTLDSQGIPGPALAAYHKAAGVVGNADPGCHIDWALIAAIGRVESDHGRYGGSALSAAGIDQPAVYGVELNGANGMATIHDTDHGVYDHDPVWDRAVGPMQFIPGTWRIVGSDLDGDGVKNPQDINDAAAATAIYLCAGPGNLADPADAYAAVRRYNNSDSYARTVLAIAQAYREGRTMLPLADLPAGSGNASSAAASGKPKAAGSTSPKTSGGGSGTTGAASPTGAPPGSTGAGAGGAPSPGGAVASIVSTLGSGLPTALPSPVSSVVCPITTIGSGLGLPPLPLPGCPTPSS
jgi:Transglycosylase SLT domain